MSDTAPRKKICLECHRYPCACATAPQPPHATKKRGKNIEDAIGVVFGQRDRIAALEAQLAAVQQANVMARDIAEQANQRAENAERKLAEAQACPACHGTGEVLPAGPSDAPVEFCVECVKGLTLTCDFYRKMLGVQRGELAEAQERLAMAVEALEAKVQSDHADMEFGYLIQDGDAECVICGASADCIANIEHPDCSQVVHEKAQAALTATAEAVAAFRQRVKDEGAAEAKQRIDDWAEAERENMHAERKEILHDGALHEYEAIVNGHLPAPRAVVAFAKARAAELRRKS